MQKIKLLLPLISGIIILGLSSCNKNNTIASEIETTFDLTGKQGISESLTDDANNLLDETTESLGLSGNKAPIIDYGTLSCATVTVSPGAFPKTITLDFGSGCTNPNSNIERSGIVHIVLSDSFRLTGSTAIMTFDNYYVNGYKKEGTITWTNTSTATVRSWSRQVVNGKITAPDGRFWFHNGLKQITQVAGNNTPRILLDDAFSITGSSVITNSLGDTRTATIETPLHKRVDCDHVDEGSIRFQGPNHFATLDFGNGTCDAIATISINNYQPRTITLP
jgi:hypothetical protein